MIRYYEWGDEQEGCVSVWVRSKDGRVVSLGEMKRADLPDGANYDCPYN